MADFPCASSEAKTPDNSGVSDPVRIDDQEDSDNLKYTFMVRAVIIQVLRPLFSQFHDDSHLLSLPLILLISSYDTRLWEEREQQDVYLGLTDNKEDYASRTQGQSQRTWPSPPSSSPQ